MNRDIKYHDLDNINFKNWVYEITSLIELKDIGIDDIFLWNL